MSVSHGHRPPEELCRPNLLRMFTNWCLVMKIKTKNKERKLISWIRLRFSRKVSSRQLIQLSIRFWLILKTKWGGDPDRLSNIKLGASETPTIMQAQRKLWTSKTPWPQPRVKTRWPRVCTHLSCLPTCPIWKLSTLKAISTATGVKLIRFSTN